MGHTCSSRAATSMRSARRGTGPASWLTPGTGTGSWMTRSSPRRRCAAYGAPRPIRSLSICTRYGARPITMRCTSSANRRPRPTARRSSRGPVSMHAQAYNWIAVHGHTTAEVAVLDLGGRDINGSVRPLFPAAAPYVVLDVALGENVDVVADAATWTPDREYDVVVCWETFEHTADWPAICVTAFKALRPGGRFLATMAGPGRPAHSGIDGGWTLHPGEHYGNVKPYALQRVLEACGFARVVIDQQFNPSDVRALAVK